MTPAIIFCYTSTQNLCYTTSSKVNQQDNVQTKTESVQRILIAYSKVCINKSVSCVNQW